MTIASLFLTASIGSSAHVIRVDGEGYLRLIQNGRVVFAREVRLALQEGRLGAVDGPTFLPSISYSGDLAAVTIDLEGNVWSGSARLGRLVLAMPTASQPMVANGSFFVCQDRPTLVNPGDGAAGVIRFNERQASLPKPSVGKPQTQPSQSKGTTHAEPVTKSADPTESLIIPTPPSGGIGIAFRSRVFVETSQFTLGQVAEVGGQPGMVAEARKIVLGETPNVGIERKLDLARIQTKLRAAGLDLRKVKINLGDSVRVSRKGQAVSDAEFIAAAIEAIEAKHGKYGELLLNSSQPDMTVPLGNRRLVVDEIAELRNGYRVGVTVYVDDVKFSRRSIQVDRRGVPAPLSVGQSVRVRVISGGIKVETTGRVTRAGRAGDLVEVVTADGVRLTGSVSSNNTVEVHS